MKNYSERIQELTERAKDENEYTLDCDVGECAYLFTLIVMIKAFKSGGMSKQELTEKKKILVDKLTDHYQHKEIQNMHIDIRNKYSNVLTEAEKRGCPICKKLVRIFDGREK